MSNVVYVQRSTPWLGLLTLLFITLKLTGTGPVAAWSWWWVLSPIWLPFVVLLLILAVIFLLALAFGR